MIPLLAYNYYVRLLTLALLLLSPFSSSDYIRCLAVHPTQSFVISSSDDMLIKLWDWEKNWQCVQVFEGHTHYVMQLTFNPKDPNTFASASLDRTIKVPTAVGSCAICLLISATLDAPSHPRASLCAVGVGSGLSRCALHA